MILKVPQELGAIYPNLKILLPENSEKSHFPIRKSSKEIKRRNFVINYIKRKTDNFSKRQIVLLCMFSFVDLLATTVVSIQVPFYPEVARAKGATATEYGFVFGIFEFTTIIASPLFGANLSTLGPKRLFIGGILTTGICSMIFGLLNNIKGRVPFISCCLIVRVLGAVGNSAYTTASFALFAQQFPDAIATIFAILETCNGLGLIIGPILGGFLYELGGYSLPFLFLGGLLLISALVASKVLPVEDSNANSSKRTDLVAKTRTRSPKMLELIKIPVVAMTSYGIVTISTGDGFLFTLLEDHLQKFKLGKVALGFVFILSGAMHTITVPFWGYVCDHIENPKLITLFGSIFSVLGLALIGPLPMLPFDTVLWVTCIGQILCGVGKGAVFVSGFIIYLNVLINRGYPDDVSTYGFVSGLWTAMVALGFFIGPTVGGILEDSVGFRSGSLFIIYAELILIGMLILFLMKICRNGSVKYKGRGSKDNISIDFKNGNGKSVDCQKLQSSNMQTIWDTNVGFVL